jgi:hypothetical protein
VQQQQQQQKSPLEEISSTLSLGVGVAQIIEKPWEVLCRQSGTPGPRYYNWRAILGCFVLLMYPSFYPQDDPMPMMYLFYGVLIMFAWNRVQGYRSKRAGYQTHSRWMGTSRFAGLMGDRVAKLVLEPGIAIALGWSLLDFNRPLGGFLVYSGIARFVDACFQRAYSSSRQREIRDGQIEAQVLSDATGS